MRTREIPNREEPEASREELEAALEHERQRSRLLEQRVKAFEEVAKRDMRQH